MRVSASRAGVELRLRVRSVEMRSSRLATARSVRLPGRPSRAQLLVLALEAIGCTRVGLALLVLLERDGAARDLVGQRGGELLVVRARLDADERARFVDARLEHRAQLGDREITAQPSAHALKHLG